MNEKVAIIIPTKNRFDFIKRLLQYYHSVQSFHPIYIGDSSDDSEKNKILKILDDYRKYFEVHYFYYPAEPYRNGPEVMMKIADNVKEKYCTYAGDDDFFIPTSLSKCANFLENNNDYRTAQGKRYLFSVEKDKAYGQIKRTDLCRINDKSVEQESAEERLISFSKDYWGLQFSVHRTNEFIRDSENFRIIEEEDIFHELIHCFTFIARGKSKFLDCFYLLRQAHENRIRHDDIYDWIANSKWNSSYNLFIKSISNILIDIDGLSDVKSREISQKVFWTYLHFVIEENIYFDTPNQEKNSIDNIKNLTKHFLKKRLSPNRINLLKNIRDKISSSDDNLLSKKSKYYNDFIPLLKTIEKK